MITFNLGQMVMTSGISARMDADSKFGFFLVDCLKKYQDCDWGDTCAEDARSNNYAASHDERILAVYIYPADGTKVWFITEWDRSATTILFHDEY